MNKVILMGRLTRDPELRFLQSNTALSSFGLAVPRRFKREGDPDADFFNITCFGKTAEFTSKWFTKGMQVVIIGRVQLREWEDKTGAKRASLEVTADEAYFTSDRGPDRSSDRASARAESAPAAAAAPQFDLPSTASDFSELVDDDGDVPF